MGQAILGVFGLNFRLYFLSRGVYGHFEISPRDSCIIAQLAFASFYRSQSREMGTMLLFIYLFIIRVTGSNKMFDFQPGPTYLQYIQ